MNQFAYQQVELLWTVLSAIFICMECSTCVSDTCSAGNSTKHKLSAILEKYDAMERPGKDSGKPTKVTCDIYINSFDSVNVDTMDYSLNIYLRQSWKDSRLAFKHIYPNESALTLNSKFIELLWVPDLFFPNEKKASSHCATIPNRLVRISPDGTILYSARYSLTLACQLNLRYFPLDKQECQLLLESYGYTTDDLQFKWRPFSKGIPVEINDELQLPQFQLVNFRLVKCNRTYMTGNYTCLRVVFNLKREYGYYIIQNYVPSVLIVLLSWVSFWVNIDAVPARISLGVLTVLTMTTQNVGVWMSLPRVSYIKAVDIWMASCVLFVFSAMVEFAIVNTLARKEIRRMSLKVKADGRDKEHAGDILKRITEEYTYGLPRQYDLNSRMLARKTDKISRILFPFCFVILNIIYWSVFLNI